MVVKLAFGVVGSAGCLVVGFELDFRVGWKVVKLAFGVGRSAGCLDVGFALDLGVG